METCREINLLFYIHFSSNLTTESLHVFRLIKIMGNRAEKGRNVSMGSKKPSLKKSAFVSAAARIQEQSSKFGQQIQRY